MRERDEKLYEMNVEEVKHDAPYSCTGWEYEIPRGYSLSGSSDGGE